MTAEQYDKRHLRMVKRLRQARLAAGLTQARLAEKVGLEQSKIARIERGLRGISVGEFLAFCRFFKQPPQHFEPSFPDKAPE